LPVEGATPDIHRRVYLEVNLSRAPLCRLSSERGTICLKALGQRGEAIRIRRQPQQGFGEGIQGGFRRRRPEEH
jgi:hypothetical protein